MDQNGFFLSLPDADLRDQLIFDRDYDAASYAQGGICQFQNMSVETAKQLLNCGFLSPEEKHNELEPSVRELVDFIERHDPANWVLHGYSVSPKRPDVRVSIEGIRSIKPLTAEELADYLSVFNAASELIAEAGKPVFCRYD